MFAGLENMDENADNNMKKESERIKSLQPQRV
jgi:hypothetical protein